MTEPEAACVGGRRWRPGSPNKGRYLLLLDSIQGPVTVRRNVSTLHHLGG